MKTLITLTLIAALCASSSIFAHETADDMAKAAAGFLQNLDDEQRAKATFEIKDDEREDWHFIPKPFEGEGKRSGLPIKEMRHDQRLLALALLSTGLSHNAYVKALNIMTLEQVLFEIEKADKRNPEMYYVSIFGTPGAKAWGWRVEGHHISMNFTIADGKVVAGTPVFFASNPARVPEGPRKGLRVLAEEEDVARVLVQSLDAEQKKVAIIDDKAPNEVITAAERTAVSLGDAGLPYGKLTEDQKKKLHALIDVYVNRLRPDVAADDMKAIEAAGLDKIVFAWAGGTEVKEPHYYRVQGPTFILEYANTQNGANHVHAVWRDFNGDFGRDVLGEHFAEHHKAE